MVIYLPLWRSSNVNYEERYDKFRQLNLRNAYLQKEERNIVLYDEPIKISQISPLPGKVDGEHYYAVADFILAEYKTELGALVANAFGLHKDSIGFDPYGKIMVGMQFVDRKAGNPVMARLSFAKEHELLYAYLTEKQFSERTKKAISFLASSMFHFPSAEHTKRMFPTMLVIPEMKEGVIEKLYSMDSDLARYITM